MNSRDFRAQERCMLERRLNRRDKVAGNLRLQNVPANSGIKGARNDLGRVMLREHQQFGLGKGLANEPGSADSVKLRHTDVENDDLRYQLHGLFEGLASVRGLTDHVPASMLFQQVPQPLAEPGVVVSNQDRHHSDQADETLSSRSLDAPGATGRRRISERAPPRTGT